jgi:hypothetical protein
MSDPIVPPGTVSQNSTFPNPAQDRDLDAGTVAWFCIGCPYLGIKNNARGNQSQTVVSSGVNSIGGASVVTQNVGRSADVIVDFADVPRNYAAPLKVQYVCTSPNKNFLQEISSNYSTLGVGFCPFLDQKMDLLYDHRTDEGM